ncbi:glycosyl hydrolase [Kribbella sp. NPDC056861]|uniref:glycosyl hydrolase n=1 Tax=Kribbella sp. NPDC056861 TaxID=3154857 RepID=UPI003424D531
MPNISTRALRRALTVLGIAALSTSGLQVPGHASESRRNPAPAVQIADDHATPETRALFSYLQRTQGQGILFGHQHDLSHGFTFSTPNGTASDTLAGVGDYPAVFGWDTLILQGQERPGIPGGSEATNIAALSTAIEQGDARGGLNTLSAHLPNFVTGGGFYDTSGRVVSQILPGAPKNAAYNAFLDRIAAAVKGAQRPDGTAIPVIFRPFHENNGGWFWWGAGHATSAEYIEIYRYTVEYLRDTKKVHNLLYSYSPNSSFNGDPTGYLKTYPGDEFVDILGYDAYDGTSGSAAWLDGLVKDLAMVVRLADERGKVAAYTEFGESGPEGSDPQWFTKLLNAIKADPQARRVAFMLTWANFGGTNRAYVPYPAHDGVPAHVLLPDFAAFANDPYTVFASGVRGAFSPRTRPVRNEPFLHLVTPTDRQRVTTTHTTIRARIAAGSASRVTYSINGGPARPLRRDAAGFYSAGWTIDPNWLDNRKVTIAISATVGRKTLTDSALVLLGEVPPLAAGWVDDFEQYAGDDLTLSEAYSHINANTTTLSPTHKAAGAYGLAYAYDFTGAGYTGIGKPVDANWSSFTSLRLWLQGDGSTNGATLQIVADGVYFEYGVPLSNTTGQEITAPFDQFKPAPWDTGHAGAVLDLAHLSNVTAFNLYLGHGAGAPTTGVVHVDQIRAE